MPWRLFTRSDPRHRVGTAVVVGRLEGDDGPLLWPARCWPSAPAPSVMAASAPGCVGGRHGVLLMHRQQRAAIV